MFAGPFDVSVFNLAEMIPATSIYYETRHEAYQKLCEMTGQDFGHDAARWQKWGREHGMCYPGASDVPDRSPPAASTH